MKRVILFGILLALSLIMVTCPSAAEVKITNKTQNRSPQGVNAFQPTAKSLGDGNFYSDWYDTAIKRLFHLRVDNITISRFILSIDDNLKISTPASGTMTTRITIGDPGIKVLPYTDHYNLGFGITNRLSKGLSVDTSVSFSLNGSHDVIFWVTLPTIRF